METKFNFNSQICTSKIQSERLLALGLKKETADMVIFRRSKNADWEISPYSYNEWQTEIVFSTFYDKGDIIPAWSLGRLIEMVAQTQYPYYVISKELPIYDALCERIEWLIKEGYFNKEFLVDQETIEEHCKGVLEYLDYIREED